MSDQPVRADYSAGENKIAEHLGEALSYFVGLPTATIEEKEDFARACLDLRMQVIQQAIRRESQKPRITKNVQININGNPSLDQLSATIDRVVTKNWNDYS